MTAAILAVWGTVPEGQRVLYQFCTAEPGEVEFLEFLSLYFL
jgi:hypothetical protein